MLQSQNDIMKTLGFDRAKKVRASRLSALQNPIAYEEARNRRVSAVKDSVRAFYANSFKQYTNSGFSEKQANEHAEEDSAGYAKVKMAQVELDYPLMSGATMAAGNAPRWAEALDPYKGVPMPRARAAPRARAPAKKAGSVHMKNPARVKAGKKAAATRKANMKKK
jgi:hypothetical protein